MLLFISVESFPLTPGMLISIQNHIRHELMCEFDRLLTVIGLPDYFETRLILIILAPPGKQAQLP